MKKALFLSLAIGSFAIMSCNKCQECTITTYQNVSGITQQLSQSTDEYCGDQYDDAPAEGSITQDLGLIQQEVTTTCQDK